MECRGHSDWMGGCCTRRRGWRWERKKYQIHDRKTKDGIDGKKLWKRRRRDKEPQRKKQRGAQGI